MTENSHKTDQSFHVTVEDFEFTLTEAEVNQADLLANSQGVHLIHEDRSYNTTILERNPMDKQYTVVVNGNRYQVNIADEYDALIKKMGLSVASTQGVADIKAPMPGLVIGIEVEEGQAVEQGTPMLILEAMKMENVLKSNGAGVVKKINIEQGQAVEKGQVLIELE